MFLLAGFGETNMKVKYFVRKLLAIFRKNNRIGDQVIQLTSGF